jgi:hypothetical protein
MQDLKNSMLKKGSEEELAMLKSKINEEAQAEINSSKLVKNERDEYVKLVNAKRAQEIKALEDAHHLYILKQEKEQLEISLRDNKKTAEEIAKIKRDLLDKEEQIIRQI